MSCAFSRDTLALHVEGDLPPAIADAASQHLERCQACREFFERLRDSQSLLKSLRRETVSPAECTGMRDNVMATLNRPDRRLGWALRIERITVRACGRPAYVLAACAIAGIVSASVLAQMRHAPTPGAKGPAAIFEGTDALLRPDGYREWVLVSEPSEPHHTGGDGARPGPAPAHRVYIDPEGYRAYAQTGTFSEGTVMIWESIRGGPEARHPHSGAPTGAPTLLASVKDSSRFDGGWGFFDFTGREGSVSAKARPQSESSVCRTCHLEEAETDSVFTQFYSALRFARQGRQGDEPGLAHS